MPYTVCSRGSQILRRGDEVGWVEVRNPTYGILVMMSAMITPVLLVIVLLMAGLMMLMLIMTVMLGTGRIRNGRLSRMLVGTVSRRRFM